MCKNKKGVSICARKAYLTARASKIFGANDTMSHEPCGDFTFLHIDGRPCFAKLSIDDIEQVKIAAIDPDL